MRQFLLVLFIFLSALGGQLAAQSFRIDSTQIEIAVAPEFNHAEVRVPIMGTPVGFNYAGLSVTSDVPWVVPSVDTATGEVALSFQTAGLISSSNTGTISVSGSGTTDSFFVKASVAPLNIVKLGDDPLRSRTYGIQQNGVNLGSVVVIDPLSNSKISCVTVGKKPADLAVSQDGSELLVINCADKTVTAIDLATLRVKETITLAQYDNWGVNDTTADIAYGPGSTIYYTDGAWAPVLRVFDRATKQVTQSVLDNSNGIGDFALSPDGKSLFAWVQYGWSAGWAGSYIVKFSVDAQGKLTFVQRTNSTYPTGLDRDPLDSPVLIDSEAKLAFIKQVAVSTTSVTETKRSFPKAVYSISPGGEIAVTDSAVFQASTGINLLSLPVTTPVQAITSDYARLVYFNKTNRTIGSIDLLAAVGPTVLNRDLSPADGSITLAPQKLEWSPIPGVDRYRVYLGQSETEVQNATPTSSLYLGEVNASAIQLTQTLSPGTTYYWRVDAVTQSEVVKGTVYDFTVSLIGTDRTIIETATVQGHSEHKFTVQLTSATPQGWQATSNQPWVKFESNSGTTPSTLTVVLDASQLQRGLHSAQVSISLASGGQSAFVLPVTLEVEPLAITAIESDRASGFVYAISEDKTQGGTSRAYLLEVDTVAKALKRVVRVGTSATDLAVHNADGRVYVTNWIPGSLLAIDMTSFTQVRAYGFAPFGGTGYGEGDAYRIAAGTKGRLVVEEEDQWVDISIFDTENGTKLDDAFVREGGGEFGPGGRFYYHGENNSSGAEVLKFDVTGDVFTELASRRVESFSYYGSRTVVVSENGERVFWNGGVLNKDLVVEWLIGKEIYAASADGKYAFGEDLIYDVDRRQPVLAMPVVTRVSAYNSTSGKLVVQNGSRLQFFDVKSPMGLTAPVLSVDSVTATSVKLVWTDESLETGFTLQRRNAGSTTWEDIVASLGANSTTYTVSNLAPGGAYDFRIKADSSAYSSDWSAVVSATTSSAPLPTVLTSVATSIGSTVATLNGSANPNGVAATGYFEYGVTSDYGSTTSSFSFGGGTSNVPVSRALAGLKPGTTYYYRLVVTNAAGVVRGAQLTFTTNIGAPSAVTGASTNVGVTSATVSGTVNPGGGASTARFEYGLTTAYGSSTDEFPVGSGTTSDVWSRTLTDLLPGATYYYRIVATNAGGTVHGSSKSFKTLTQADAPHAVTSIASSVGQDFAVLRGNVSANGSATYVHFEYGADVSYGHVTGEFVLAPETSSLTVSSTIANLSPETTYHYRAVARNALGVTYGQNQFFTTSAESLDPVDDEAFTTGRQAVVVDVLSNDSPRSVLRVVGIGQPFAGSAHANVDGSVTYTPGSAFKGVDTFTYRIADNSGNEATATVTVRDSYLACSGIYNGLVGTRESGFTQAGSIMVKASPMGAFTGVLKFAGKTHRLKGKLRHDGEVSVEIRKTGGAPLLLSMRIDPAAKQLTGSVAAQAGAVPFTAIRAAFDVESNPAPQAGRYTMLLPRNEGLSEPSGHGFATMAVTASGVVTITGRSGTGVPFTTAGYVGGDARFPFYAVESGKRSASFQGWVTFRSIANTSDCDGTVGWSRLLPNGEELMDAPAQMSLVGSRYIVPTRGRLLLPWEERRENGVLKFGGGPLGAGSSPWFVSLSSNHKFTLKGNGFSMKLNAKTGAFSGRVALSTRDKPASIHGVLFQRQAMGAGVVRTKYGSGWVTIEESLLQTAE